MASTGKKGKMKWIKVDQSQLLNATTRKITSSNWADESNDPDDSFDFGGRKAEVTLPTAPRAARGPENDAKIPQEPPFQAYVSNLSYEVTEDDLADFFANLRVKSVRLPRDERGNTIRAKGFGYVEFDDRNSLIEALSMPDTNLKNRRMRIEVADGEQGRSGRGGPRDRGPSEPDRTMGDWRSGPRSESDTLSSDRDGFRPRRDYGSDRGGMYGDRRGGGSRDDDRDRGGFRKDGDRSGFRYRDGAGDRYERRGFDDRREDRREFGGGDRRDDRREFGGGDRREFGGGDRRDDRRDFGGGDRRDDRREFGGGDRRDYGGGGDRGTWRKDPGWNDPKMEREPNRDLDKGEPKTRTKLNLQPRSRPVEERLNGDVTSDTSSVSSTASSAASIFGQAKPVDTSAREREIEERLAKQRDDRIPPSRDESKVTAQPVVRDSPSTKEDAPTSPSLEPAPPPKENVWARRSQQVPPQTKEMQDPREEEGAHQEEEGGFDK